ncbi:MAG: hypothetical protein ACFE8L_14125 [Candidatus Hodarchaeota archaeon]
MSYDLSAFKVLIKKIFPPKKCVYTLDTTGNGKADSVQITALNVIIPFVFPENIEIGDFNIQNFDMNDIDISNYVTIYLDNELLNLSKENVNLDAVQERLMISHGGELFTLNNILEGKLSGRTIALGDKISVIIKLNESSLEKLTEGKHIFKIESELITGIEIRFELEKNNMNLRFDSNIPSV